MSNSERFYLVTTVFMILLGIYITIHDFVRLSPMAFFWIAALGLWARDLYVFCQDMNSRKLKRVYNEF